MTAVLLDRATPRQPVTRPTRGPAKPRLRLLDQVASRRRARHRSALLVLFMAVLAGLFAVAFVHAELVAGQHDLDAVRTEITEAEARHAELARAVEEASAPAVIVERATSLGMVRAQQPVYLVASAPVRDIEVGPSLAVLPATTPDGGTVDPAVAQVAAPASNGRSLRGSLGEPGGISGAATVEASPTLALDAGPVGGASTQTATPTATSTAPASTAPASTAAAATATVDGTPSSTATSTGGVTVSGPVSSIAGTRAATAPAANPSSSTAASAGQGSPLASAAAATAEG